MSLYQQLFETIDDSASLNQQPKCSIVDKMTQSLSKLDHPHSNIEDSLKKLYKEKRSSSNLLKDKANADLLKQQAKRRRLNDKKSNG